MMVNPAGRPGGGKIAPACADYLLHEEGILLGVLHEIQIFAWKDTK